MTIRTELLRKTYIMGRQTVHALTGVDLEVPAGEFLAIFGPSGSGKSTLLHLIGGLDRPSAGSIRLQDQELGKMDEHELAAFRRRHVGFVFQSFHLISSLTALENVALPLRFAGISRRERRRRAEEMLARVGMDDRMHHRPGELSGGQQQRVAIARALINEPALLLADEPTGNLDTRSGDQVMQLFAELHQQGRTVLVVSHDERVKSFATRAVFMLDGKIVPPDVFSTMLAMPSVPSEVS